MGEAGLSSFAMFNAMVASFLAKAKCSPVLPSLSLALRSIPSIVDGIKHCSKSIKDNIKESSKMSYF